MFLTMTVWILVGFIFFLSTAILRHRKEEAEDNREQPPGPPGIPVLGHLHLLGDLPHRTFLTLAKKYGPIMSLKLGQVPTIVVSSAEAAEQFFKTHDTTFVGRPKIEASKYLSYGGKGLVYADYGPYWRSMRKLCTLHLLSSSKVEKFTPLRVREVEKVVESIKDEEGRVVDLSEVVHTLLEDIVFKMTQGSNREKYDFKWIVHEGMRLIGAFNIGDYVPWLAPLDLQGLRRSLKKYQKISDEMTEKIVQEHMQIRASNPQNVEHKDFMDILLSLEGQPIDPNDEESYVLDRANLKAIGKDMVAGSLETTSTVIIWALSLLLKHPRVMKNLQDELATKVGMNKRVEVNDLGKLSYMDMVIKESLRLYPAGSLIIRKSLKDAKVNDYYIKQNSLILINLWAIGRDTKVWSENAEEFYPERFIGKDIDLAGSNFGLLPFGSGRRRCPGMQMGLSTFKLVLSQLVHCFNWELPYGMKPDELDMDEKFGLSMPRAKNLLAVPTYRLKPNNNESN